MLNRICAEIEDNVLSLSFRRTGRAAQTFTRRIKLVVFIRLVREVRKGRGAFTDDAQVGDSGGGAHQKKRHELSNTACSGNSMHFRLRQNT